MTAAMTQGILLVACLVLAVAVGALGMALVQLRREVRRLAATERAAGSRQARPAFGPGQSPDPGEPRPAFGPAHTPVELVETPDPDEQRTEFVITRLGEESDAAPEPGPAPTLEARLFADVVLRESVVKAASFVHGVRRGLSPANRNRIWFEMRQEVKRSRKARKAEEREAIREWRARKRASLRESEAA